MAGCQGSHIMTNKPKPTLEDHIRIEVQTEDGLWHEYDHSSYGAEKPVRMPLNQIIPGLQEGILLMKPKDTFILYIPSTLAYGEKGAPAIEPNQGIIFKIDLIDIIKGSAPLPKY